MYVHIPMPQGSQQAAIAALIFLFVMWLIVRIVSRIKSIAQNVAYNNFPFLKKSVEGFQAKLDYLTSRIDTLESRIYKLEKDKTGETN